MVAWGSARQAVGVVESGQHVFVQGACAYSDRAAGCSPLARSYPESETGQARHFAFLRSTLSADRENESPRSDCAVMCTWHPVFKGR